MADVSVSVDLSGIRRKLSESQFKRAKVIMANQMLLDMNRFVPMDKEHLRPSGHVDSQENLVWSMIYARAQFYGFVTARDGSQHRVHNYTTAGTSRRWDLRAKAQYGSTWKAAFVRGMQLGK